MFPLFADDLTELSSDCETGLSNNPSPVDILAVIDGTFAEYQGRRLIAYVIFYI